MTKRSGEPGKKLKLVNKNNGSQDESTSSIQIFVAATCIEDETEVADEMEHFDEADCVDIEIADDASESTTTTTTTTSTPVPSTPINIPKSLAKSTSNKKQTIKQITSGGNILATANSKKLNKRRRDSGTSSDEERWLTAVESGKLDDLDDELKKMKDPKLMTARQRAMYERNLGDKEPQSEFYASAEMLMSLPIGYREREKPQTAEDIQKAVLKSQKRKQLADEKREKDKKKTMERLLKKQESTKQRGNAARSKAAAAKAATAVTFMRYRSTPKGSYIQLPINVEFPLAAQNPREPPPRQLCGIAGCAQAKVYNCSKTNMPLCSLACYRKNVESIKEIMC